MNKYYKPILLVMLCTLFTSAGQIFFKIASANFSSFSQIITNFPLWAGFFFYGIGAALMIIALKYGELSLVYPFIALSFIWVNVASIILFSEQISLVNWIGITGIFLGVSLIGIGTSRGAIHA